MSSPKTTDIRKIIEAFNTEYKCAMYFKPFRQLKLDLLDTGNKNLSKTHNS